MEWFFVADGKRNGPVQQGAFDELIRTGKVGPQTFVWRAGMEKWQRLEEVSPAQPSAAGPAAPAPETVQAAAPAPRLAACGVCGAEHGAEDLMQFRGTLVCPACKPAFVQRMREGTSQPGQLRYAGFWIRFAAKFIDGLILGVVSFIISMATAAAIAGMMAGGDGEPALGMVLAVQGLNMVLQFAVQVAFVTFFLPRYSATPGKMATGLIVVRSDGSTLTAGRAFGRCCGEWLSSLTLGIGYLMAAFDEEKRALHDRVCDTRVAYKAARA